MNIIIEGSGGIEKLAATPFAPHTALISITDVNFNFAELKNQPDYFLQLKLASEHHTFNPFQSKKIADFVKRIVWKADTLICICEHGQSRSAGVAAAVRQYQNGDGTTIFADERYNPNKAVYNSVYNALCSYNGGLGSFFGGLSKEGQDDKKFQFSLGVTNMESGTFYQYALSRGQAKAAFILFGLQVTQNKHNDGAFIDKNLKRFEDLIKPFNVSYNGYHGLVWCIELADLVKEGTDILYDEYGDFFYTDNIDDELDRWGVLHLVIEGLKAYNAGYYAEWSKAHKNLIVREANLGAEIWSRYCDDIIKEIDKLP